MEKVYLSQRQRFITYLAAIAAAVLITTLITASNVEASSKQLICKSKATGELLIRAKCKKSETRISRITQLKGATGATGAPGVDSVLTSGFGVHYGSGIVGNICTFVIDMQSFTGSYHYTEDTDSGHYYLSCY